MLAMLSCDPNLITEAESLVPLLSARLSHSKVCLLPCFGVFHPGEFAGYSVMHLSSMTAFRMFLASLLLSAAVLSCTYIQLFAPVL